MSTLTGTISLVLAVLSTLLLSDIVWPARISRIGYLGNSSPSLEADLVEAFRRGLRERGYVENQNIVVEYRWAEGQYERFPALVADLVRLKVDVIVTAGTPGARAATQVTPTIPIVMAVAGDPVASGLVASHARPGGNVTGSALPTLTRVAVLWNPANPVSAIIFKETQLAASALGVTLQPVVAVREIDEFAAALATIGQERPDALAVVADRFLLAHRRRIVDFAAQSRLPAMYPFREFADDGGLMAYAPSYTDLFRRTAIFVDKILKGAKPGDLPVEQPSKFELVINAKTAKALGLTLPESLLTRADEVIE
jgi:putative tryptophan/tyrosine transport system substrate-binding protein